MAKTETVLQISKFFLLDDVALVKLNAHIQFTDGVQLACLPEQGSELEIGDGCFATGWGETRGSGSDEFLKQVKQVVVMESECGSDKYNPKTQICVRNYRNTPCIGDSGGPLVCKKEDGKWYVFGATSQSTLVNGIAALCATPDLNFLFAKILDKANWIKFTIENNK
ncbi:chymotrypsin-like elastase family member 3B [Uloborus diversus]|uniref:chymotrypsin-like elastase family member 3B n=1 Tax=Uloborus diversus TaxID=327109 RepID=UPI002409C365|nr:chymotrypsin-like elastase family member 3B [Uloborus diversus]